MNYRHAYHAGNFADVFKHAVLLLLLTQLRRKETAFRVVDTHAGRGCYDLESVEAGKTAEFEGGIGRIRLDDTLPAGLDELRQLVQRFNPGRTTPRYYPGSPHIIRSMLRPCDRLTLAELHPEEVKALRHEFATARQVTVLAEDAYAVLKATLPPKERRGLVLIDPPYEEKDEFVRIVRGLQTALSRWPSGLYAIWYPIKAIEPVNRFLGEIATLGRPALTAELLMRRTDDPARFNGCGMILLNPPWKVDQALSDLLTVLHRLLGSSGESAVRWLTSGAESASTSRVS